MGLDNRVVLWKPHPSHLVSNGPREWTPVSPFPFLDPLRKDIGSKVGAKGFVAINPPRISDQYVIGHVLAYRGEVDTSGDTQTCKFSFVADSGEH